MSRFVRLCPVHRTPLDEGLGASPELRCPEGHDTKTWLVVDREKRTRPAPGPPFDDPPRLPAPLITLPALDLQGGARRPPRAPRKETRMALFATLVSRRFFRGDHQLDVKLIRDNRGQVSTYSVRWWLRRRGHKAPEAAGTSHRGHDPNAEGLAREAFARALKTAEREGWGGPHEVHHGNRYSAQPLADIPAPPKGAA